jgi:glucose/arabinose dehydrogenase
MFPIVPGLLLWLLPLAPAQPQELPAGFAWQTLAEGLNQPVALAYAPAGDLYVATKPGLVLRLPSTGGTLQTVLDLSAEVNSHGDRGLLGLALPPAFTPDGGPNSWIYLLLTLSPLPGLDPVYNFDGQYSWSALVRLRLQEDGGSVTGLPGSWEYLLGERQPDGLAPTAIASLHQSHSNGALRFGSDGSLLVATGDGARYFDLDVGGLDPEAFEDSIHPQTGLKGPYTKSQDLGAFRSRSPLSLAGKILRIDPQTGLGLPSNPYYDGDGSSLAARIFAQGFRNPFRMALDSSLGSHELSAGKPGLLVVSDVGSSLYEELNAFRVGGFDGGWPCMEGPNSQPDYSGYTAPESGPGAGIDCASLGSSALPPTLAWNRFDANALFPAGIHLLADGSAGAGFTGGCGMAGAFYQGQRYPETWQGSLLFGDFVLDWLKAARFGPAGELQSVQDFGSGWPRLVDAVARPADGDLVFLFLGNGLEQSSIRRLRFGLNQPPSPSLSIAPASGPLPLSVQFDARGSSDPDQDPLTYRFDFGDGWSSGPTTASTVEHTYTQAGIFEARVEIDDGQGGLASLSQVVSAGISNLTMAVFSPPQGTLLAGQDLSLSALALDETGQSQEITWHLDTMQDGQPVDSLVVATGNTIDLPASNLPALTAGNYLRLRARTSAGDGSTAEVTRYLLPSQLWRRVSGAGDLVHCLQALEPPVPQGSSSQDPEVLRDLIAGQAAAGHQATFDSQHPLLDPAPSWFGITRPAGDPQPVWYAGVDLVTGINGPVAGQFESLAIEVLEGGQWLAVENLCAYPALGNIGGQGLFAGLPAVPANFTPIELRFAPRAGTGLRVSGVGAGGGPVSLSELTVFALQSAPQDLVDHSAFGLPIARVLALDPPGPQGAGNPNLGLIRDGTTPEPGSTSLWAQFDSQHPDAPAGDDWFGYRFPAPVSVQRVLFQGGRAQSTGGALGALAVEVQTLPDGPWLTMGGVSVTPPWPSEPGANPGYTQHQLDLPISAVCGLRISGPPTGSALFASCAELRVLGPSFDATQCGFSSYGNSDLGGVLLTSATKPAPGLPAALAMTGGEPGGLAFLGVSPAPADLLLAGGQRLLISPIDLLLIPLGLSATGSAGLHKTLADSPSSVGVTLYFQALVLDPLAIGGWRLSNGLSMRICP